MITQFAGNGSCEKGQYIRYRSKEGGSLAMSSDIYVSDPESVAYGMRQVLTHKMAKDNEVIIEVRERPVGEFKKVGRLVRRFVPIGQFGR